MNSGPVAGDKGVCNAVEETIGKNTRTQVPMCEIMEVSCFLGIACVLASCRFPGRYNARARARSFFRARQSDPNSAYPNVRARRAQRRNSSFLGV